MFVSKQCLMAFIPRQTRAEQAEPVKDATSDGHDVAHFQVSVV